MKVAGLGTGIMGAVMARNLLRAGHDVTVWNRTPEPAAAVGREGAAVADSPRPTPELLETARSRPHHRRTRLGDQVAGVHLLAAWFRRHPEERQRLIVL